MNERAKELSNLKKDLKKTQARLKETYGEHYEFHCEDSFIDMVDAVGEHLEETLKEIKYEENYNGD